MFHSAKIVRPEISLAIAAFMARRTLVLVDPENGLRQFQRLSPGRRKYLRSKNLICRKAV